MSDALAQKMFEKVKDQLGEIMTEEDLKPIVQRAVDEAFFKDRGSKDQWGRMCDQKPPLFIEMIEGAMKTAITESVKKHMDANPTLIADAVDRAIAKGFTRVVMEAVDNRMQAPLYDFAQKLRNAGLLGAG